MPGLNFSAAEDPVQALAADGRACGLDPADLDVARPPPSSVPTRRSRPLLRFRVSEIRVAVNLFGGQRAMAETLLARMRQD